MNEDTIDAKNNVKEKELKPARLAPPYQMLNGESLWNVLKNATKYMVQLVFNVRISYDFSISANQYIDFKSEISTNENIYDMLAFESLAF